MYRGRNFRGNRNDRGGRGGIAQRRMPQVLGGEKRYNNTREGLPMGKVLTISGNDAYQHGHCYKCLVYGHEKKDCLATPLQLFIHKRLMGQPGHGWSPPSGHPGYDGSYNSLSPQVKLLVDEWNETHGGTQAHGARGTRRDQSVDNVTYSMPREHSTERGRGFGHTRGSQGDHRSRSRERTAASGWSRTYERVPPPIGVSQNEGKSLRDSRPINPRGKVYERAPRASSMNRPSTAYLSRSYQAESSKQASRDVDLGNAARYGANYDQRKRHYTSGRSSPAGSQTSHGRKSQQTSRRSSPAGSQSSSRSGSVVPQKLRKGVHYGADVDRELRATSTRMIHGTQTTDEEIVRERGKQSLEKALMAAKEGGKNVERVSPSPEDMMLANRPSIDQPAMEEIEGCPFRQVKSTARDWQKHKLTTDVTGKGITPLSLELISRTAEDLRKARKICDIEVSEGVRPVEETTKILLPPKGRLRREVLKPYFPLPLKATMTKPSTGYVRWKEYVDTHLQFVESGLSESKKAEAEKRFYIHFTSVSQEIKNRLCHEFGDKIDVNKMFTVSSDRSNVTDIALKLVEQYTEMWFKGECDVVVDNVNKLEEDLATEVIQYLANDEALNQLRVTPTTEFMKLRQKTEGALWMAKLKARDVLKVPWEYRNCPVWWCDYVMFGPGPSEQPETLKWYLSEKGENKDMEYDVKLTIEFAAENEAYAIIDPKDWGSIAYTRRQNKLTYISDRVWLKRMTGPFTHQDANAFQKRKDEEESIVGALDSIESKVIKPVVTQYSESGVLEYWYETPQSTMTNGWGGPERRRVNIQDNFRQQFVPGDQIIARIRVQDKGIDYLPDLNDGSCEIEKPLWIPSQYQMRAFVRFGMFWNRPRVKIIPAIVMEVVWRKDTQIDIENYKVPDPRTRTLACPSNVAAIKVKITRRGITKYFSEIDVPLGVITPVEDLFNWDHVAPGCPMFLRVKEGEMRLIPREVNRRKHASEYHMSMERGDDEGFTMEANELTEQVQPHWILEGVIGQEALLKWGHWYLPCPASLKYLDRNRMLGREWTIQDCQLEQFCECVALSGEMEYLEIKRKAEAGRIVLPAQLRFSRQIGKVSIITLVPTLSSVTDVTVRESLQNFHFSETHRLSAGLRRKTNKKDIWNNVGGIPNRFSVNCQKAEAVYMKEGFLEDENKIDGFTRTPKVTEASGLSDDTTDMIVVGTKLTVELSPRHSKALLNEQANIQRTMINGLIYVELTEVVDADVRKSLVQDHYYSRIIRSLPNEPDTKKWAKESKPRDLTLQLTAADEFKSIFHAGARPNTGEFRKLSILKSFLGMEAWPKRDFSQQLDAEDELFCRIGPNKRIVLTEKQTEVVRLAGLKAKDKITKQRLPELATEIIVGPPGTGKSTTATAIIQQGLEGSKTEAVGSSDQKQFSIGPDNRHVLVEEVYMLCAGTNKATENNARNIKNLYLHWLAESGVGTLKPKTHLYDHPLVRPILFRPLRYQSPTDLEEELLEIEINYLMYDDPYGMNFEKIKTARESFQHHRTKWIEMSGLINNLDPQLMDSKKNRHKFLETQSKHFKSMNAARLDLLTAVVKQAQPNVILCTLNNSKSFVFQYNLILRITTIIFDEAAFATTMDGFSAVVQMDPQFARMLILIGDAQQLAPNANAKGKVGQMLKTNVMSRLEKPSEILVKVSQPSTPQSKEAGEQVLKLNVECLAPVYTLDTSFRHSAHLCNWWSEIWYNKLVHSGLSEAVQTQRNNVFVGMPTPVRGCPVLMLAVRGNEKHVATSRVNEMMCEEAVNFASLFRYAGCQDITRVAIISPYEGNKVFLNDLLLRTFGSHPKPKVLNSDSTQGNQYEVVIYINGRCAPIEEIEKTWRTIPVKRYGTTRDDVDSKFSKYFPGIDHKAHISLKQVIRLMGFCGEDNRLCVGVTRPWSGLAIVDCPRTSDINRSNYLINRYLMGNGLVLFGGTRLMAQYLYYNPNRWYNQEGRLRTIEELERLHKDQRMLEEVPPFSSNLLNRHLYRDPPQVYEANIGQFLNTATNYPQKLPILIGEEIQPLEDLFVDGVYTNPLAGPIKIYSEVAWNHYIENYPTRNAGDADQLDEVAREFGLDEGDTVESTDITIMPMDDEDEEMEVEWDINRRIDGVAEFFELTEEECKASTGPDRENPYAAPCHLTLSPGDINTGTIRRLNTSWIGMSRMDLEKMRLPVELEIYLTEFKEDEDIFDLEFADGLLITTSNLARQESYWITVLESLREDAINARLVALYNDNPAFYQAYVHRYECARWAVSRLAATKYQNELGRCLDNWERRNDTRGKEAKGCWNKLGLNFSLRIQELKERVERSGGDYQLEQMFKRFHPHKSISTLESPANFPNRVLFQRMVQTTFQVGPPLTAVGLARTIRKAAQENKFRLEDYPRQLDTTKSSALLQQEEAEELKKKEADREKQRKMEEEILKRRINVTRKAQTPSASTSLQQTDDERVDKWKQSLAKQQQGRGVPHPGEVVTPVTMVTLPASSVTIQPIVSSSLTRTEVMATSSPMQSDDNQTIGNAEESEEGELVEKNENNGSSISIDESVILGNTTAVPGTSETPEKSVTEDKDKAESGDDSSSQ